MLSNAVIFRHVSTAAALVFFNDTVLGVQLSYITLKSSTAVVVETSAEIVLTWTTWLSM